jgi:hypothetical protein
MKQEFLTLYDYGQGGVWTVIVASSEDELRLKYPELEVVSSPPGSMTQDDLEEIRSRRPAIDIDDVDDPFLRSLRDARE